MSNCWATSYDELAAGPTCATSFWPATYTELVNGPPPRDPMWFRCSWVYDYNTLISGPVCQTPEPIDRNDNWIVCPTEWARISSGGAWHVPDQDWTIGLLTGPLMHRCALPWGHIEDHYCDCTADKTKPGEEGTLTPPDETVDPPHGILPVSPLPTNVGGPLAALLAPELIKADVDVMREKIEGLPPDAE